MKRYTIICRDQELSSLVAKNLHPKLQAIGMIHDLEQPELIITIGGDGTLLHAVHSFIDHLEDVAFIGLHTGTLGFFTDYTSEEIDEFVNDLQNEHRIVSTPLIHIECFNGGLRHDLYAMNEGRIENIIKTQTMDVYIDDEYLEKFRGNGLCVSAQIGSTAYNRSIDGAIIDSQIQALQLTEISGIHHKFFRSLKNPIILHPQTKISLRAESFEGAMLVYDHLNIDLHKTTRVDFTLGDKEVRFLRLRPVSYFSRLRNLF